MTGMVKLAVLAALVGIASAAPRIINDQAFVDAINAVPGITWQAGASERFNGMTMSEFRSMNGVKPGSWKEVLYRTRFSQIHFCDHVQPSDRAFPAEYCAPIVPSIE